MPRKRKRRSKKPVEEFEFSCVKVGRYAIRASASVNSTLYSPQNAWTDEDDDPVHVCDTHLSIAGVFYYPDSRSGHRFDIDYYGDNRPSRRQNITLNQLQKKDEHGIPQYRTYRGDRIPVYREIRGIGTLDKVRGENAWRSWLHVSSEHVLQLSIILGQEQNLYLSMHEVKKDRARWIREVTLQTTDPAEE